MTRLSGRAPSFAKLQAWNGSSGLARPLVDIHHRNDKNRITSESIPQIGTENQIDWHGINNMAVQAFQLSGMMDKQFLMVGGSILVGPISHLF